MNYLDQAIVALNTKIALDPKQQDLASIVDLLILARTEYALSQANTQGSEAVKAQVLGNKGIQQKAT